MDGSREDDMFRPAPKLQVIKIRCKCCGEVKDIDYYSSGRAKTCSECMEKKKMEKTFK